MGSYRDDAVSMIAGQIEDEEKAAGGSSTKQKTRADKEKEAELDIKKEDVEEIAEQVEVELGDDKGGEE